MSMSTKRLIVLTMLISTSLLIFSPFQALGYSADSKLNISRCEIKDQTLFYEGSFSDKRPITIMARNKENPLDIRYMRIITPDAEGSFRNNIKFYDEEISADLFEMEVLFQADEDVPVVSFELPYFNKTKKTESINEMIKSSKGILDFMTSDEDSIKIYNNMGVQLDLYNKQDLTTKNKINISANSYKSSVTTENVVEIANGSIYTVLANRANAIELKDLIYEFDINSKAMFVKKNAIANTERFSKLSAKDQEWIATNVYSNMPKGGFNDYGEFYKAIRNSMFLRFANTTHYMELNELILSNTDILENEMNQLKNETNTNILDAAMADVKRQSAQTNFSDIKTFIQVVNDALIKAKSGTGIGNGSGGGSGSSGGSGSGTGFQITIPSATNNSLIQGNIKDNKSDTFNDLAGYDWAADAIKELNSKGIDKGISNEKFEPGRNITREEFVTLICRAFNLGTNQASVSFNDVHSGDWFAPYVCCAVEMGIIYGLSDDEFGAGINITREDMAAIVYRTIEKMGIEISDVGELFADDNDISEYAKYPIKVLSGNHIISGIGDNMFAPKKNARRAEAAVIIHRCMEKFGI